MDDRSLLIKAIDDLRSQYEQDAGEQQEIIEDAQRELDRIEDIIDALGGKEAIGRVAAFMNEGDATVRNALLDAHKKKNWDKVRELHFRWLKSIEWKSPLDEAGAQDVVEAFIDSL